jgi:agmatinase
LLVRTPVPVLAHAIMSGRRLESKVPPAILGRETMRKRVPFSKRESFFGLTHSSGVREFVVVGVPWDVTSTYRRGAAEAPNAIRKATSSRLYNRFTELGLDLGAIWKVCDHGNARARGVSTLKKALAIAVNLHNHEHPAMFFLGGDHFITYLCFSIMAEKRGRPLSLLYFDAHPDLYETYEGDRYSHATVVSRILDEKNLSSGTVCYAGIRASTREQNERIGSLGLTVHTTHDIDEKSSHRVGSLIRSELLHKPVYLSLDLDCLDPAFAPGVGNPQPGGLTVRQILDMLHALAGLEIVAADIVEYCPKAESGTRTTAFTSAILIKELMGMMTKSERPQRR